MLGIASSLRLRASFVIVNVPARGAFYESFASHRTDRTIREDARDREG
jgi:hypothetical protein